MAQLPKPVKVFIVTQLARFEPLKVVQEMLKERFGLTVSHQQVSNYDPSTVNGERMSPELKAVFDAEREKFRKDIDAIPIANKAVRLAMLQRAALEAQKAGNRNQMAALVKQAAEEVGEVYTNKRSMDVKGKVEHDVKQVPDSDLVAALAKFGVVVPLLGAPSANQDLAPAEAKAA